MVIMRLYSGDCGSKVSHHLLRSYGALMEQSREMMFVSNGAFLQTSIMSAHWLQHRKWNVSEALEWTSIQCIILDKSNRYLLIAKFAHHGHKQEWMDGWMSLPLGSTRTRRIHLIPARSGTVLSFWLATVPVPVLYDWLLLLTSALIDTSACSIIFLLS